MHSFMYGRRKGFTSFELIITLSLFAIVSAVTVPLIGNFQQTETIEGHAEEFINTVRRAQHRSMTGERDTLWGVYIMPNAYTLFAGSSYATRNQSADEVHTLPVSYSLSGLTEAVFQAGTGVPTAAGTVTLSHTGISSKVVVIGSAGSLQLQ